MKRYLSIFLFIALALSVSCYAVYARQIDVYPDIEFSGTQALCTAYICGDMTTDQISATLKLKQGSTLIDEWSASGYGVLNMEETATVRLNKTYTLTVEFSVNGVAQAPVSISRTNR